MKKLVLFGCLAFLTSCQGQVEKGLVGRPAIPDAGPKVIRNFKAIGLTPDFDTTLVSQYIRSIFQDSKGHLWFGTIGDGVVRYDGNTLTYFSDPEGFISQSVFAINEDQEGNMWFGTDQGVYKYDGTMFRHYGRPAGLEHIDISRRSILVDRSGMIWVGTHAGVYRYDPMADGRGMPCFSLCPFLPVINVADIFEDKEGALWFATSDQGVFRYDGTGVGHLVEIEGLGENYAGGISQDSLGNMWFTSKNGICKYDGKTFTAYTHDDGLGGIEFWGILVERSGIIWITARGYTTRFDPSVPLPVTNAFTVYTPADGFTCCVQSMYQDRSGNVWWGTGQGLFRFDGNRFYQVRQEGPWGH